MPHELSRRSLLAHSSMALAAAGTARLLPPTAAPRKQRILVLGGTSFLGPAVVTAALAKGHEVTLWNRGRTNPGLFPGVEKLKGQRRRPSKPNDAPQDLEALRGRHWDAVVDTGAYFTAEVEDLGKVLAGHIGQYVLVSSLSVYKTLEVDATPVDENSPLCECADKYTLEMGPNYENYGALKRYCEEAASAAFPGKATLVRPGYIVGPGDPTDRFTYWPARFDRGGECLAPGDPDNEVQFVDVRDLGEWIVHLIEQGVMGPLNAVGFDGRISVAEFLHTGKGTLNHGCTFTWVDDAFLEKNGITAWQEMGCWTPKAKNGRCSNTKALAAGAKYRPIAETIRDTAAWAREERGNRKWRAGITAERESELLQLWRTR